MRARACAGAALRAVGRAPPLRSASWGCARLDAARYRGRAGLGGPLGGVEEPLTARSSTGRWFGRLGSLYGVARFRMQLFRLGMTAERRGTRRKRPCTLFDLPPAAQRPYMLEAAIKKHRSGPSLRLTGTGCLGALLQRVSQSAPGVQQGGGSALPAGRAPRARPWIRRQQLATPQPAELGGASSSSRASGASGFTSQ